MNKHQLLKKKLINFENKIRNIYEKGKIKAPIHLSSNNEDELIDIFKKINKNDWVLSSWRNHYHALLKGISEKDLFNQIKNGRSMFVSSKKHKFYASSIVAGILPIALGIALSIKKKRSKNKVWVFIGDMTFETGVFHECYKYAKNFKLPIKFVIEDNNLSTNSPTDKVWGRKSRKNRDLIWYNYTNKFPHHGTGKWILF